ncbi:uncharacterized protein LOC143794501 [Ranitomeya variabilis]|uniref:uncharacterized protein LOC143794501 n=1 Tax=Ranitomeya variabilis TaxID=490064 RepID=UPI0040559CC3
MDPIHPQPADNCSMHMQEVDYTGGHHYRGTITEYQKLGDRTPASAHLYLGGDSVEEQDLCFSNQPTHFLTSEKSEHSRHQDLGEEQRFGGGVKVQVESGTCTIKESSSEMSSKECIQRRKWKLGERSSSWDVVDSGDLAGELLQDNRRGIVEVNLEKTDDTQHKHMNVILYKMEEDESRLWSEGHNHSMYSGHITTHSSKSREGDDRMKKVKLYRRAQSENLVSYLQGSIRALTRSASESSDGNRQVTRLSLQRMGRSHSTDHLLEGVGQMVSSVHALMCTSVHVQAQEITKNSNNKESLPRSRGPPKRIYQLDALCKENLSDTGEEDTLYTHEDSGSDGAAEEVTSWNIGASQNAKPPQYTPPSPCTEVFQGVFSKEKYSQTKNSSKERKQEPGDIEEKVLSVADARRAFEVSSSSDRKAAACHSNRGHHVETFCKRAENM